MNNTQTTTRTPSSDYNIEKESIVNATNELLKWYHGCTSHFTAKAKEIIESSDNPDIIENVIADFLNDEAIGICRELDFEVFGNTDHANNLPQDADDETDLDDEEDFDDEEEYEDEYEDDGYSVLLDATQSALDLMRKDLQVANNKVELYKATLEGNIESEADLIVKYKALATENEALKNRLNELLYGNQESGE